MTKLINLTTEMVEEINRIGRLRSPVEACGVLVPTPMSPRHGSASQVVELPNRSLEVSSYHILPSDLKLALGDYLEANNDADSIAMWHTHPQGHIGPSRADMQLRHPELIYLVVALLDDGTAIPTWF